MMCHPEGFIAKTCQDGISHYKPSGLNNMWVLVLIFDHRLRYIWPSSQGYLVSVLQNKLVRSELGQLSLLDTEVAHLLLKPPEVNNTTALFIKIKWYSALLASFCCSNTRSQMSQQGCSPFFSRFTAVARDVRFPPLPLSSPSPFPPIPTTYILYILNHWSSLLSLSLVSPPPLL